MREQTVGTRLQQADVAKRQSDVPAAFEDLEKQVCTLSQTVERLCGRLDPVLRPEAPVPESISKQRDSSCQISRAIRHATNDIERMCDELNRTIDRLEV